MISIVVPAYNESRRIRPFMDSLVEFARRGDYEIIAVDDGSTDDTLQILQEYGKKSRNMRVLACGKNMGKGYAVRQGVMNAAGDYVIFIDADGSIHPAEIKKMVPMLEKYDVVAATRSSPLSDVRGQPKKRKFLGVMFNVWVNIIFQTGISDSLCGFKGFRRKAAIDLFRDLKSSRWVFDVEIFHKMRNKKYTLYQLPITWTHKEGSKIGPLDPVKMLFELAALRLKLML